MTENEWRNCWILVVNGDMTLMLADKDPQALIECKMGASRTGQPYQIVHYNEVGEPDRLIEG